MSHRAGLLTCVLALAALGCSQNTDPGLDAASGGGDGGFGDASTAAFDLYTLDPLASGDYPLSLAVSGQKIAVAYWADIPDASTQTVVTDGGTSTLTLHELRYAEKGGSPEVVGRFYNVYGGSLALDSTGQPYVAFLGPPSNAGSKWVEACATVATRPATGGTWTSPPDVAATVGDQVVGLWASIAVDSKDGLFVGYRNIHFGQFPVQDYQHSNLEAVSGKPGAWTGTVGCTKNGDCPVFGGDRTDGHGGYLSIAVANDQPAFAWSTQPGGAMDTAHDIWFTQRSSDGTTWPTDPHKVKSVANTGTGPSGASPGGPQLAWQKGAGFMIAWDDHNSGQLFELQSSDGIDWSGVAQPVVGSGTGGWYPAAAFTPDGFPAVAYYVCSNSPGATYCPPAQDELDLTWMIDDVPETETVDPDGGHWMRLAYWQNQQAVVAYRDVHHTAIKLAIQK